MTNNVLSPFICEDPCGLERTSLTEPSIDQIPPELLLIIFSYVTPADLLYTLPLVCKAWRSVTFNPVLRKRLMFRKDTPVDAAVDAVATRKLLEVFKCRAWIHCGEVLPHTLSLCHWLQCLDIGFCTLNASQAEHLAHKLPPTLMHLNVEGMKVVDLQFITTLVSQCPRLEALNLSHCDQICNSSIRCITNQLTNLVRLNVDGALRLTDATLEYLSESLASKQGSLTALWLDGLEFTSAAIRLFLDQISQNAVQLRHTTLLPDDHYSFIGLHVLWISFCDQFTDQALEPLVRSDSFKLTALTLRKAQQISVECWMNCFPPHTIDLPVSSLGYLQHLDLNDAPNVTDNVVQNIVFCCGCTLRSLSLNWCCELTDTALDLIVTHCPSLRCLSLVGDHLLKGSSLVYVASKQPDIHMINLTQCNSIDDGLLHCLVSELPDLYVFDYFGERVGKGQLDDICHFDVWRSLDKVPICNH